METVGMRIRRIRKSRGLTITELSQKVNYSRAALSRIENGDRGTAVMRYVSIAKALGCRIDDLFPEMDEVQEDGKPVRADGIEKEKAAGQAAEDGEQDDDEWGGFDFT